MTTRKPLIRVPFDQRGNLMHYAAPPAPGRLFDQAHEWRDRESFYARLHNLDMASGRSAKYFLWHEVDTGARYPMFVRDMIDLINKGTVCGGVTEGWFEACKRGQNYGIRMTEEPDR